MKKYIAFIPVRGGSKSIPLKNIKNLAGKPLVYWVTKAADMCRKIEKIYVSTDSEEIKKVVLSFGFEKLAVIDRSKETATDEASTESAMVEFAEKYEFENIVFLQATSPLTSYKDIENAIKIYESGFDSVLSVVRQKRFIWEKNSGSAIPVNYDYKNRPRRQEFSGYFVENGAIYITSKENLLKTKNRLSGRIGLYEMPEYTYYELDEPEDWIVVENLMKSNKKLLYKNLISKIKVICFDVDGVFTDGGVYYSAEGENLLKFSRVDGKGIELALKNDVDIWVISAEDSNIVRKRLEKLKIKNIYLGVKDKLELIKELADKNGLLRGNIAFMGDDIQDLPAIQWCGFSGCPKNGVNIVKQNVFYVCDNKGGSGAVREFIDLVLVNRSNIE